MKLTFLFSTNGSLLELLYRTDFRREHVRVFSSGVTTLPENDSFRESRFPELAQEGNSFLRTRNSRKPIRFTGSGFRWQWARKDQFRSKDRSTAPDYPCKLTENSVSCRVQIEDAVDQGNVDLFVGNGQLFGTCLAQIEVIQSLCAGDFSSPTMTHGRTPPGVAEIQRMKGDLSYKYVETDRGGKVLISAANPETLKAVHEFLRFQIEDHQTGDAEAVQK